MKREIVTAEQIRALNKLSWDRTWFANCCGNGENWLEVNFELKGHEEYKYKILCDTYSDVENLRGELDPNTILKNGHWVQKRGV